MHVKPLRSELCVDLSGFGTPPRTVDGGGRRPLCAIAGNTLRGRAAPPLPPLSLCPSKDDPAAFLDMCAVIRPGHVREKIALFAPDRGGHAPSTRAGKVKSSRRENGDAKRRRRRSAAHKNLRRDPGTPPANGPPAGAAEQSWTEGAEHKVSVGAMVAFLEQRRRCRGAGGELAAARTPPLAEDPESVRVSDVVAKLECLRRCDEGEGAFTRPRRWAGRLPLTAGPAPSPPPSPSADARYRSSPPGTAPSLGETAEPPPGLLFLSPPPPPPPPSPRIGSYESAAGGAANDFAETRRRLGELLEPPAALATLPPDVLAGVFALLPTRALAALKCTCRYFKSVIENYGVRPADSLWAWDPRYRDDPCKRCKRRYGRGDASPCRWHHKPYCQALPFGPGFWLCCRRLRRDAPGCNVGLHDNRWVPAACRAPGGGAVCRGSADD